MNRITFPCVVERPNGTFERMKDQEDFEKSIDRMAKDGQDVSKCKILTFTNLKVNRQVSITLTIEEEVL